MKHPDPHIDTLLTRLISPRLAVIDLSLDRIYALLAALGNPHEKLPPVVHVAGTNGKGSLLAYLAAMLEAAGYRAHRYISPHLVRFNERIKIAGKDIDDAALFDVLARVEAAAERCPVTFFEATTAAAFLAFAEARANIVLLETGLGGRLDATNVIAAPLLTCITPVSIDHAEYLGNTIPAIAAEKAGIIKRGVPCVTGPQVPEAAAVIEEAAKRLDAPLFRSGKEWEARAVADGFAYRSGGHEARFPLPGLVGAHQMANAATAVACAGLLKGFAMSDAQIAEGIRHAAWPARLQRLTEGKLAALLPDGSELWLDGGHNPAAGAVLGAWARAQQKPVRLLCGMLRNKDAAGFLAPLAPWVQSLTAVPIAGEPLAQEPEKIAAIAREAGIRDVGVADDIPTALQSIVARQRNDTISLICGSLYLAGNILWLNNHLT